MRGEVSGQHGMFSYVSLEERVRPDHPLRAVKARTEAALKALSPVFSKMYAAGGRPSIAPERLLKAQLLIALFSVRSDRQFCEQLDFNLLFRWFLDMPIDERRSIRAPSAKTASGCSSMMWLGSSSAKWCARPRRRNCSRPSTSVWMEH